MDLKWLRERLHQQLAELRSLDDIAASAANVVELDQTSVGRLSRIDALQGQAMAKASQQRRKLQVIAIKAALTRLENGSFGLCLECDEQIGAARLQHNPAVAKCLRCAARSES